MTRTAMVTRTAVPAGLLLAVALVAGCSSSGGSSAAATRSSSTRSSSSSASGTSAGVGSAAAAALAAKMRAGLVGLTSAHVEVDAGALVGKFSGDVAYSNGTATGSDITLVTAGDKTELVTVGATTYAKLPPGRNTSGKPWAKVSSTSNNEFVRALSSSADIGQAVASLPALVDITASATSAQQTSPGHYALVVEPAKAGSNILATLLASLGQKTIPVALVLDSKDRPTNITISAKLGSQSFPVVVAISKFDSVVTITAPPAEQVSSS